MVFTARAQLNRQEVESSTTPSSNSRTGTLLVLPRENCQQPPKMRRRMKDIGKKQFPRSNLKMTSVPPKTLLSRLKPSFLSFPLTENQFPIILSFKGIKISQKSN